ncbi:MAG: hypothetical protein ACOYOU_05450 [Kiritimatiellia bacterium]
MNPSRGNHVARALRTGMRKPRNRHGLLPVRPGHLVANAKQTYYH